MCFQPSPSSPIHKNPISRRAEVRSLSLSLSHSFLLLFSSTFSLLLTHAHKQSPSFCVITTPTITQTITQISGLPACLSCCILSWWGRKTSRLNALKTGCLTRVQDTVIPRNNMRGNSKNGKTYCQSQLSHMKGHERKSLSTMSLLQSPSLLHRSAQAVPEH